MSYEIDMRLVPSYADVHPFRKERRDPLGLVEIDRPMLIHVKADYVYGDVTARRTICNRFVDDHDVLACEPVHRESVNCQTCVAHLVAYELVTEDWVAEG